MKRDELRALLEGAGITPRRSSGQNFLVEENLALAIARDGEIGPEDVVLEIGTGVGILTQHLLAFGHHVVSVEKDHKVLALAREVLGEPPNLTLVEADALANKNALGPEMLAALRARLDGGRRLRVVANLPYSVATPLVVGLLSADLPLDLLVVMVQYEAAERFAAQRGDESYGAVSALCEALASELRIVRKVPREVFMPRPKVQSAVIRIVPRPGRLEGFAALSEVVRALFNYRRKTLAKAAEAVAKREPALAWVPEAVTRLGLDPKRRTEDLGLDELRALAGARG